MYQGVTIHSIRSLSMMPSLGAMIGSTHSSEVLERLNAASGGVVIFGQPGDPVKDRYQFLQGILLNNLNVADAVVTKTRQYIEEPNKLVPITSIDDVNCMPVSMQLPIVMYEPIRTLLNDGRIYGFGIDPRFLPEEDVYGRLANNGKADISAGDTDFVWEFKSDDPELSEDDIEAIELTRGWIDNWLVKEMQPGGSFIDPTDPSNKISKKKRNK